MPHELISAFNRHQLSLNAKLCAMLNEEAQHRTERRGCGFTQASRFLAALVNSERSPTDPRDLSCLFGFSTRHINAIVRLSLNAGWELGWRQLDKAPLELGQTLADIAEADVLLKLEASLTAIATELEYPESQLILSLIRDILLTSSQQHEILPFMANKPDIGSCTQAEVFFLEIAHAKIRRGGHVNLFQGRSGAPLLIEKMQLGESFSALSLAPVVIGGVTLPPGSLIALTHHTPPLPPAGKTNYQTLPIDTIKEARFLRLTTLALNPRDRERAFSSQFKRQVVSNMLSPTTTTLDDLRHFATTRLDA